MVSFKLGILNPLHDEYSKNLQSFLFLNKFSSVAELREFSFNNPQDFEAIFERLRKPTVFNYSQQAYSSIRFLVDTSTQDYRYLLAMTSGGRTINERPCECFIDYGADVDILSAYGNRLKASYFPFGRPRVMSST